MCPIVARESQRTEITGQEIRSSKNKEKKAKNFIASVVLVILLNGVKGLAPIYVQQKWPTVYQSATFDQIAKYIEVHMYAIM